MFPKAFIITNDLFKSGWSASTKLWCFLLSSSLIKLSGNEKKKKQHRELMRDRQQEYHTEAAGKNHVSICNIKCWILQGEYASSSFFLLPLICAVKGGGGELLQFPLTTASRKLSSFLEICEFCTVQNWSYSRSSTWIYWESPHVLLCY